MNERFISMIGICVTLGLVSASASGAPAARPVDRDPRTITVPGEGAAQTAPDEVTITVGVTREGAEARNARMELTAATRSVLAILKQRRIAEADIQTGAVSLSPNDRFDAGKRTIAGYRAASTLTIRLRALDDYDAVLGAIMQAGANEFHGAQFGSSRQADLESRARADAVADAKRRAEALAAAAGAKVGAIIAITEGNLERPPVAMHAAARAMGGMRNDPMASGPAITGGEITVRVSIQATWALE